MANHQSLPHHGKPPPALSLMLNQFTEKNLRRLRVASGWLRGAYRLATRWPEGGLGVASTRTPASCILPSSFPPVTAKVPRTLARHTDISREPVDRKSTRLNS